MLMIVGHQEVDVEQQGAGDEQPLELPAAELMGELVQAVIGVQATGAGRPPPGPSQGTSERTPRGPCERSVGLEDGVVRAEDPEHALHPAVVLFQGRSLEGGNVDAVKADRAWWSDEAQDHLADGALATAALADER